MSKNSSNEKNIDSTPAEARSGVRSVVVKVDIMQERKHALGWSDSHLAKTANVAKNTLASLWKNGFATFTIVEATAKALGLDLALLIRDQKRKLEPAHDPAREQYRAILLQELYSDNYANHANSVDGLFKEDFLCFVNSNRAHDLYFLSLSQYGKDSVVDELCAEGLLSEKLDAKTGRPVYIVKRWGAKECRDNLMLRLDTEASAAMRVINMLGDKSSKEEYESIKSQLRFNLDEMGKHIQQVDSDENLAKHVMVYDGNFHQAWAGFSSLHRLVLENVVNGHYQLVNYYQLQIKIVRQKCPQQLSELPTFASIARSSYEDLKEILELFEDIKNASEQAKIVPLINAIKAHPQKNFAKFQHALKVIGAVE